MINKHYLLILFCFFHFQLSSQVDELKLSREGSSFINKINLYEPYQNYIKKVPIENTKNFIFKGSTTKKYVALTFDDGPNFNTKKTIEFLKSKSIPATFFIITRNLNENNVSFYSNNLFEIALHCNEHHNFNLLTYEEISKDFEIALKTLDSFQLNVEYYRPPYGIINSKLIKVLNSIKENKKINDYKVINQQLTPILWSHDSVDWGTKSVEEVVINSTKNLSPGSILLFHEASTKTSTLEIIINKIYELGFEIVPLRDLL